MSTAAFTAERIRRGKRTFVVITGPNGFRDELGGKRAERAAAAIIIKWASRDTAGVYGLRQTLDAAQGEARRLTVVRTPRGYDPRYVKTNAAEWAMAVPVWDADESEAEHGPPLRYSVRPPCTCQGYDPADPCMHGDTSEGCPRHDPYYFELESDRVHGENCLCDGPRYCPTDGPDSYDAILYGEAMAAEGALR